MCCPCYSRMVVLEWPNCLNGKSFLPGRGRGMTNFQLCGSGNWAADDPLIKTKKRRFRVSLGHDCLTHIWGGSNLITIEVSNLQGPILTPVYNVLFLRLWFLTSDIMTCHMPHTLCPPSLEHIDTMSTSRKTNLYPVATIHPALECNQQGIPS